MSEISKLTQELQDYPATDPRRTIYEPHPIGGFYCLIPVETRDKIVATLHSLSEHSAEADSYHKFWIEERDRRIAAETIVVRTQKLADEIERCEHGHFLIDIAKAIRSVVSGSTEAGNG